MTINRKNSPYSAALTGCSFMFFEFNRCLPLLMDEHADVLLKKEIEENQIMLVNSISARKKFVLEFKRRYKAVPRTFWLWYITLASEKAQRAALFYVILKTYRLIFDFHFHVAVKKWKLAEHFITKDDIMMEFNEIAASDEFVDSWSENTKDRCASQYLTYLRHTGLMDEKTNELRPIHFEPSDVEYYIRSGFEWFLEAAFLFPYEINDLKAQLL